MNQTRDDVDGAGNDVEQGRDVSFAGYEEVLEGEVVARDPDYETSPQSGGKDSIVDTVLGCEEDVRTGSSKEDGIGDGYCYVDSHGLEAAEF